MHSFDIIIIIMITEIKCRRDRISLITRELSYYLTCLEFHFIILPRKIIKFFIICYRKWDERNNDSTFVH